MEACLGRHLAGVGVDGERLRVGASDLVGERVAVGVVGGERVSDGRARRAVLGDGAGGVGRLIEAGRTGVRPGLDGLHLGHGRGGLRLSRLVGALPVAVGGRDPDPAALVVGARRETRREAGRDTGAEDLLSISVEVGPAPVDVLGGAVGVGQRGHQGRTYLGRQRRQRHHAGFVDVGNRHRHRALVLIVGVVGGNQRHVVARLGLVVG